MFNLGRAISLSPGDSLYLSVQQIKPNGDISLVHLDTLEIAPLNYLTKSIQISVDGILDLGENQFIVKVDHFEKFDEMHETNNTNDIQPYKVQIVSNDIFQSIL